MYIFLMLTSLFFLVGAVDVTSKNLISSLNPEVITANYGDQNIKVINSSLEYVFLYPDTDVSVNNNL